MKTQQQSNKKEEFTSIVIDTQIKTTALGKKLQRLHLKGYGWLTNFHTPLNKGDIITFETVPSSDGKYININNIKVLIPANETKDVTKKIQDEHIDEIVENEKNILTKCLKAVMEVYGRVDSEDLEEQHIASVNRMYTQVNRQQNKKE